MFVELLTAGHQIAYEPTAIIEHQHRATMDDLDRQIYGYGLGFTAMLTAVTFRDPWHLLGLAAIVPAWLRSLRAESSAKSINRADDYPPSLARAEFRGMTAGPLAYLRARRATLAVAAMTTSRAIRLPRVPKWLTVNALALMTATIGANALGLVFWAVAAHLQPPAVVGQASAAIAALTLLAMIAQLNLTNVIVRLLPAAGKLGTGLVARAYLVVVFLSLVAGLVYCVSGLGRHVVTGGWVGGGVHGRRSRCWPCSRSRIRCSPRCGWRRGWRWRTSPP